MSQPVTCPICSAMLDFVKDNQYLKCRSCSYMTPVTKTEVTPL